MNEISIGVSKFNRKEITVKDVTGEFLDVEARLKTKKELENRYLKILKKANKITEILELEKQIGELRSEIESFEGRLKFLENQVSFSTLQVKIYETISEQTEFGKKFKNGWENLILFFVFLVNIWPFIFIIIGITILIRVWRKRKIKQKCLWEVLPISNCLLHVNENFFFFKKLQTPLSLFELIVVT